jgi:hypothetical protein
MIGAHLSKEVIKERRYKIVYIPHEFVFNALFFVETDCITKPIIADLPKEGCEVVGVQYSFDHDAFAFKVYHPSFDVIPIGGEYPKVIIKEEIVFQKVEKYERVTA